MSNQPNQPAQPVQEDPTLASIPAETFVAQAYKLTHGDRNEEYGSPLQDFQRIADIWSALLRPYLKEGTKLDPLQVAQLMIGLKISRLSHNPVHLDSWIDTAGYSDCADQIIHDPGYVTDMIAEAKEKAKTAVREAFRPLQPTTPPEFTVNPTVILDDVLDNIEIDA